MNIALILAGGLGIRLKSDVPKQYCMVGNKPIISYCLEAFEKNENISSILIVAEEAWHCFLQDYMKKENITKFCGFSKPGATRSLSILGGLNKMNEISDDIDLVVVHDAVRALVSQDLINRCICAAMEADGSMPALPVTDTAYICKDGSSISALLNRDELFTGQAPECFKFKKYLQAYKRLSNEELLRIRGSSEVAYMAGMEIRLIEGSYSNFKITTQEDLLKFETIVQGKTYES